MSERFERLFSLTGNLYAESSPVIIAAGALLKDTETGKILAQLKFKSISPKPIKAIKVQISPLDTVGKPLGEKITYDYLDLNVDRDMEFGQKKAIPVINPATRSFTAEVTEVAFEDNSVWTMDGAAWTPLPKRVALEKAVGNQELAKQYRIQYGEKAWYKPVKGDKIWICTCGAVNAEEEDKCHTCGNEAAALFSCDYEKLKADASKRVEVETAVKKKNSQKVKRLTAIVVPVFIIIVASILLVTKVFIPNQKYKQAADLLAAGDYIEAIHEFTALNGYKDSEDQAVIAGYRQAEALFETGDYDNAIKWFQLLADNNYFDSAQRVEEVKDAKEREEEAAKKEENYDKALKLVETGDYYTAFRIFLELNDYEDSKQYVSDLKRQHPFACAEIGDVFYFGTYEQDNSTDNGQESIEWVVIDSNTNEITLLSRYCLDAQPFSAILLSTYSNGAPAPEPYYKGIISKWEDTSLYKWLNDYFLSTAFTKREIGVLTAPITLLSVTQADSLPVDVKTPLLVSEYVLSKDLDVDFVWLALPAQKYFPNKSTISTGYMTYHDWYASGYSIVKENGVDVTHFGGVRPVITVSTDYNPQD